MEFGGLTPSTLIDYPGKIAAIVFTIGCNFRCPYCHNPELVDETVEIRKSEEEVLAFLERRRGHIDGVVITGGEPTMHGESLLSFMQKVKTLGFLVKLDSNGTNTEFLRTATERNIVDYFAMDIKAPIEKYHEAVGRPVDVQAISASIAFLKTSGIPYEFRTTVVKSITTPDDVVEIAKSIEGAEAYYIQKFVPNNILNPQLKRKVSYTDDEYAMLADLARTYVPFVGIR